MMMTFSSCLMLMQLVRHLLWQELQLLLRDTMTDPVRLWILIVDIISVKCLCFAFYWKCLVSPWPSIYSAECVWRRAETEYGAQIILQNILLNLVETLFGADYSRKYQVLPIQYLLHISKHKCWHHVMRLGSCLFKCSQWSFLAMMQCVWVRRERYEISFTWLFWWYSMLSVPCLTKIPALLWFRWRGKTRTFHQYRNSNQKCSPCPENIGIHSTLGSGNILLVINSKKTHSIQGTFDFVFSVENTFPPLQMLSGVIQKVSITSSCHSHST